MATKTEQLLSSVKFNKLTKTQYDAALLAGQISPTEFYFVEENTAMAPGGSVKSVNGQLPDGTGNIQLDIVDKAERLAAVVQLGNADFDGSESVTAEQMGVRPDTWVPTLKEVGAEPAFSKNTAFNKNFGSAADTVCQGSDSRLSNARKASNITMSYNGNLYITYS